MEFKELDPRYYYLVTHKKNKKLAVEEGLKVVSDFVVANLGYPVRGVMVVTGRNFSKDKFLVAWEFGVIGEVLIESWRDSLDG